METIFSTALEQMIVLFLLMIVGYVLQKKSLIGQNAGKVLSDLEVCIFCPCLTLVTFTNNFTIDVLREKLSLLGVSIALLFIFTIPFSKIVSKWLGRTENERAVYNYALCFSNLGYLGYPIVRAVFGDAALANMMIFCLPINVAINSYGLYILLPERGFSFKKLLKPVTIAPFLGIALIALDMELPSVLNTLLESCGNCMAPVAMLLMGIVLAEQPLKRMFMNTRAYVASTLRLIVIPLLVAGILYALNITGETLLLASVTLAMPLGLNSVVFPAAYGGDVTSGSQATFISNLMGIVTIPIMLSLFYAMAYGI
ncbi:MAG: AEC family transporter [Lachnospiraceae bacterium]|nr:AEC family transporter [Lachnospiraceae bacterium]